MLYVLLCQLVFSLSLPHLCPNDQALDLLQFNHMFTVYPYALTPGYYPKTVAWNRSTDCCSWDGVKCDKTIGQVIELDLRCSQLQGKFHSNSSLFQLSNLKRLDLSYNDFSGSLISPKFCEFSSLRYLDLSYSGFTGLIPSEISHLSKLYILRISTVYPYGLRLGPYNFELLLKNLTQLRKLDLNSVNISSSISLNFSSFLTNLGLSNTQLFAILPERVFHLSHLESLYLPSNPQLTVRFPTTKWNSCASLMNDTGKIPLLNGQTECFSFNKSWTQLKELDFSSNSLTGLIPSWIFSLPSLTRLDLSDNHFSGKIQEFKSKTLFSISVKKNQLEGPIPKSLLNQHRIYFLSLSNNNLSGQIASAICNLKTLNVIDLGSNSLEGTIPQCLGEMSELWVLDLSNNSLSGTISNTFSIRNQLIIIKLDGNKLQGNIPPSLINCESLYFLDLGNNELNDTFPGWLGILPSLVILKLTSNKLHGPIKTSRTGNLFSQLRIIDLSSNGFSGNLPVNLFQNSHAMKLINENMIDAVISNYDDSLTITTKGLDLAFDRVLIRKNIIINLSRNRFEGHIPNIIGDLIGLRTLNLSHNRLEGHIPESLQHLTVIASLDLSFNKIGGEIPQQLSSLTSLEVINLSHNHLVGCIPRGKQFATFENSSYQGNDGLRRFPLSKDCGGDDGVPQATIPVELDQGEDRDLEMISWQALLIGYGCGLVIGNCP